MFNTYSVFINIRNVKPESLDVEVQLKTTFNLLTGSRSNPSPLNVHVFDKKDDVPSSDNGLDYIFNPKMDYSLDPSSHGEMDYIFDPSPNDKMDYSLDPSSNGEMDHSLDPIIELLP